MCGASLSEYVGNGRDPGEKFLSTLSLYEAVSLKILLIPYIGIPELAHRAMYSWP